MLLSSAAAPGNSEERECFVVIYASTIVCSVDRGTVQDGHLIFERKSGEIVGVKEGWPEKIETAEDVMVEYVNSPRNPVAFLVPGFVDIHCHGLGGSTDVLDYWSNPIYSLNKLATRGGTTSVIATVTFPDPPLLERTLNACRVLNTFYQQPGHGARVEGIHAEGPIIATRGGLPDSTKQISWGVEKFEALLDTMLPALKIMTIAPSLECPRRDQGTPPQEHENEESGCFACGDPHQPKTGRAATGSLEYPSPAFLRLNALLDRNVLPALGHDKVCTENDILGAIAFAAGHNATKVERLHLTHAFNVQSFHHRNTGLSNMALLGENIPLATSAQHGWQALRAPTVEVIGDMRHVNPLSVAALLNAKRNGSFKSLAFITDAIADSAVPGKELTYVDVRKAYVSKDGLTVHDENGVLCGSCTTLYETFKRLVNGFSMTVPEASCMCSENPATIARIQDRVGKLQQGSLADVLCLDASLAIIDVIVSGKRVVDYGF